MNKYCFNTRAYCVAYCVIVIALSCFLTCCRQNESTALSVLREIKSAETLFESKHGKGSFGTVSDLVREGLIKRPIDKPEGYYGYTFKIETISGWYAATARPVEDDGSASFYMDSNGRFTYSEDRARPASEKSTDVN